MTGYRLSPAAVADLEGIWDFTAQQWDREQAERYARMIQGRIEGVVQGRIPARSADNVRAGYLKCAAGSHMIYFRRIKGEIEVIRVLHQSMDVEGQLN